MLENTDKAFANILDTINKFSQSASPDAISALSNVAMLDAQGDLRCATVFLFVGGAALVLGLALLFYGLADDNGFTVGGTIITLIALIILGCSTTTLLNPLNQAAAKDGKVALAAKAVSKIMQTESK